MLPPPFTGLGLFALHCRLPSMVLSRMRTTRSKDLNVTADVVAEQIVWNLVVVDQGRATDQRVLN